MAFSAGLPGQHLYLAPSFGVVVISRTDGSLDLFRQSCFALLGIAPEIRGRLFQPFATSGKASGIGLRLACSRKAVIDHGGEMWVESSHQGACFAFCLPGMIAPCTVSSRYPLPTKTPDRLRVAAHDDLARRANGGSAHKAADRNRTKMSPQLHE